MVVGGYIGCLLIAYGLPWGAAAESYCLLLEGMSWDFFSVKRRPIRAESVSNPPCRFCVEPIPKRDKERLGTSDKKLFSSSGKQNTKEATPKAIHRSRALQAVLVSVFEKKTWLGAPPKHDTKMGISNRGGSFFENTNL